MNHDEIDYNSYKYKKDEWLPYVKQDVLCTAFSYARYCKAMREITGFSMKNCLSAPGLRWKCLIVCLMKMMNQYIHKMTNT